MSHLALLFVVALGLGLPSLSLAKQQANSADGVPMTGVWESNEQGVKLLLKHVQNCTAASEAEELDPCLVFLLYSTSCPFSREMYTTIEGLSHQYNRSVAFVAMDNALSSLNFLMQFGFHAVPQVLIHSPVSNKPAKASLSLARFIAVTSTNKILSLTRLFVLSHCIGIGFTHTHTMSLMSLSL
jgi:hypothetical protein